MKWNDNYNCHATKIGSFVARVDWSCDRSKPGYWVSFGDRRLKDPVADLDVAKRKALALARKVLTEALAALETA